MTEGDRCWRIAQIGISPLTDAGKRGLDMFGHPDGPMLEDDPKAVTEVL